MLFDYVRLDPETTYAVDTKTDRQTIRDTFTEKKRSYKLKPRKLKPP